MDFEELLKESQSGYEEGLVKGVVVKKTNEGVFLDLKSKTDRFISKVDFLKEEWDDIKEGDELEVFVKDGRVSYSKAREVLVLEELKNAFKEGTPIDIKIVKAVKGGYTANYKGVNIFLPVSQGGSQKIQIKGVYKALIIRFDEADNNVVCSISNFEKVEKEKAVTAFFNRVQKGDIVKGTVKTIIEKGVFVSLDVIEGFIPFTEITYKRIKSPKDIFRIGDEVTAKIIELNSEKRKVTLSTKALEENPWDRFVKNFKEGDQIEGVVRNFINTGVFVEIIDGVDGFLHVSEISWTERINDPKKYFNLGDKISCLIKSIDVKNKKVSLSYRGMIDNPWKEFVKANRVGSVISCKVKDVVEKGVVVFVNDTLEGFIPNEYVSWNKVNDVKKNITIGQELTVKLIEANAEKRKLIFSLRDLTKDPWLEAKEKIEVGKEVEGVVTNITDRLVFFEVLPDVEGVVKKAEFDKQKKATDIKVGDKMMLLVKEFDPKNRKMLLSRRELELKQEKEALAELKKQNKVKVTLGDFLKNKV